MQGRVLEAVGVRHTIWDGRSTWTAFPAKKLGHGVAGQKNILAVGDDVRFRDHGDGTALTEEILPRRNKLSRRMTYLGTEHVIAANMDLLAVVLAPNPTLNTGILDRLLAAAGVFGIETAVICNKMDLLEIEEEERTLAPYAALGYRVFPMIAKDGVGVEAFGDVARGKWTLLAGHSGVGKTTLVNCLLPHLCLPVGVVDSRRGKGRHTTAKAAGHLLPQGGVLVDTAGIREFALCGIEPKDLEATFSEIHSAGARCRFQGCLHAAEPDCAVKDGVESGEISAGRYSSYRKLLEEAQSAR